MRKVLLILTAVVVGAPAVSFAKGGNHPMAGCGLGYVLFGHNDNQKIMQVLAATTNGISANQTFGMTSGTSGCTDDGAVKFVKEAEVFAEVNLDTLRREMAMGDGEYVRSFAALLGATESDMPSMLKLFQSQYTTLFPSSATTSGEMLAALSTVINGRG